MEDYTISADSMRLDLDAIFAALTGMYWCEGIPREIVERAVANSLCFGAYHEASGAQIGFARVITDFATTAYLCDVYVLEPHRGRGVSKALLEAVMNHPGLQGLRRFSLVTRDAHDLYRRFGFTALSAPERHMEILRPGLYREQATL